MSSHFDFKDGSLSGKLCMEGKEVALEQDYRGIRREGDNTLRLDSLQVSAFWLEVRFKRHPMGEFCADGIRYIVTAKGRMSDDPRPLSVSSTTTKIEIKAVDGAIELTLPSKFLY